MYNENIAHIYNGKVVLSSNVILDSFWEFAKKKFVPYHVNNKYKHEIEFSLNNPNFNIFTLLYNYQRSVTKSYIEIKYYLQESKKVRSRNNLDNYASYINNKNNMIEHLKNETWELKEVLDKEVTNQYVLKHSQESTTAFNSNIHKNNLKFYFINSIKYTNNYFTAEVRMRTLLQTSHHSENNLLLSYFHPDNTNRSFDFEIELRQDLTSINETDFRKNFINIFKRSLGISNDTFHFCYESLYPTLKTDMIDLSQLKDIDYSNALIMKKIDGEFIQFYILKGFCYIIKHNIIVELQTNICLDYEISGSGEFLYIQGVRYIFPFHIQKFIYKKKEIFFNTRKESLTAFKKAIDSETIIFGNIKKTNEIKDKEKFGVLFSIKEIIGPFESYKDFFCGFLECFNKLSSYPTDGVIISINTETDPNNIRDCKFKQNNTIDIYTNYTLNNNNNKKKDNSLNFVFSFVRVTGLKKNNRHFHELYKLNVPTSTELFFDKKLSMIVYNKNDLKTIVPVVFISEFFIDQQVFVPRLDKTNNFLQRQKYFGNKYQVILKSIVIDEFKIYFTEDQLSNLLDKTEEEIIELLSSIDENIKKYIKIKDKILLKKNNSDLSTLDEVEERKEKNYIIQPLNLNIKWYKPESSNTQRSALNILSNLNKSYGFLTGTGPFVNAGTYNSVFSIYCGKGGDAGKFVYNNIKSVVGVDPDKVVLDIFNERRNDYSKQKTKIFSLKTIVLALEEKNFLDTVYKTVGLNKTFDIIDIQLGLHFSLTSKTESHIMNILSSLSNKDKPVKTRVLISTNDEDNILALYKKRNLELNKKLVLKIDDNNRFELEYKTNKIEVFYPSSMNQPMEEYLMSKDYLHTLFEKYGFDLIQTWTFDETIQTPKIYEELATRYERESTKNFLLNVSQVNLEKNDVLEIISIFRYYIFEYKK